MSTQTDEQRKTVSSLQAQVRRLESERDRLQRTLDELNTSLSSRTDELSEKVKTLEIQKKEMELRIAELERETELRLAEESAQREQMRESYEKLLSSLEGEVRQRTVEIQSYRNALTINIMDKIFFDSGRDVIKPEGLDVLMRVGAVINDLPDKIIRIEGHTDDVPIGPKIIDRFPNNWSLGASRAMRVAEYLRMKTGIDPSEIYIVSYSFYHPRVPNISEYNRARNRRIEITVLNKELYQKLELIETEI
jgi:chemotaxis protein MotB